MKKHLLLSLLALLLAAGQTWAQQVSITWQMGDIENLAQATVAGSEEAASLVSTGYAQGANIAEVKAVTSSNADAGFTAVTYVPPFAAFTPTTKVTSATKGHDVTFTVIPQQGHTLKVTRITFDCMKVGTDGGGIDVALKKRSGSETRLDPANVARNKVAEGNPLGYAPNTYIIPDFIADSQGLDLIFYFSNINGKDNSSPKQLALRNVVVEGVMDEAVFDAAHYIAGLSVDGKTGSDPASTIDLYDLVKNLKNGETTRFAQKLFAQPENIRATIQPALAGTHTAVASYNASNNTLNVSVRKTGSDVDEFAFFVTFTVSNIQPKGTPTPLKRGIMALHTASGNLVSWRARKSDGRNVRFKLFRGSAASQTLAVNSGNFISGKTNFLDTQGAAGSVYRVDVYDENDNIVESDVSLPAWSDQTKYITLEGGAPKDPTSAGATYTPNDASFCDMDGDGEYEIVLKWSPSNEKDAASSGTTSPAFYACYKLSGKRLWILHTGHNMFNSAHTTPFVAWDLDGDGFGEFMVKTAPGAVDGEGNYVLMDGDTPAANYKNSRGKQTEGPEYITVFDGVTGAELKTIKYHTAYGDVSTSFWGDSNQNRSERYLACIAWLDGEDANPSAIFARGYYSGCNIGAYDWDGENLTLRWLHRGTAKNAGTVTYADGSVTTMNSSVYGEGAHWISVGDVTGDGKQEIHYGSGALKPDGTTLYRTGLEHGDALHLGDFIPSRPGLEFFMTLEHSPYGVNLRDARTGEIIFRTTAGSDTGRGIMAHFNPESENAYWQSSADAGLYDTDRNVIIENVSHGGGASLNNRIYWNGTLADDFYDKSVLEEFNPTANAFWRMQVNGGNYTIGKLNNDSKNNPCVLGDLLGDWREEIVNWTQSGNDFQLVINATNYQTDYTFPHLMDDFAYRAQLISQNCGYNQPPHVSYDPRTEKTLRPETFFKEPGENVGNKKLGSFWGSLYTTYPVYIPKGTIVWNVSNRTDNAIDTLRTVVLAEGRIIPAGRAVIFNSQEQSPAFIPTSLSANTTVTTLYLKGAYTDTRLSDPTDTQHAFEFRDGERGIGFYHIQGEKTIPGGTAYALFGNTTTPAAESYVLGPFVNADYTATSVVTLSAPGQPRSPQAYTIQGLPVKSMSTKGIYIVGGKKYVVR